MLGWREEDLEWAEREVRELLDEQVKKVENAGDTFAGVHLREERPAEEFVALTEEFGVDLMVVGSRGRGGIRRVLTGRVSDWVVRHARCPVLVVGIEARVADIDSGGFGRISGRHALDGSLTQPLRTVTSRRHGRGTILREGSDSFTILRMERALRELAASEAPFDSCYSGGMRKLFGFDLVRLPRAAGGELLFAWRDDGSGEREVPKNS